MLGGPNPEVAIQRLFTYHLIPHVIKPHRYVKKHDVFSDWTTDRETVALQRTSAVAEYASTLCCFQIQSKLKWIRILRILQKVPTISDLPRDELSAVVYLAAWISAIVDLSKLRFASLSTFEAAMMNLLTVNLQARIFSARSKMLRSHVCTTAAFQSNLKVCGAFALLCDEFYFNI